MLLTNRRHRLLYIAIAGMEVGWILPWALLLADFWQQRLTGALMSDPTRGSAAESLKTLLVPSTLRLYFLFFGLMLLYMVAADLLNRRQIGTPYREFAIVALVVITSLIMVRLFLYPTVALTDGEWLQNIFRSIFDFTVGRRPEVVILLLNAFLWFRVAVNTDRDLSFFRVTFSFRLGLLVTIVGNALLTGFNVVPLSAALVTFSLFLVSGLTATAIARIDEKSYSVDSSRGTLLPWSRLAQILATSLLILLLGGLFSLLYTPGNIRTVLFWFSPLWRFLAMVVSRMLFAVLWLIAPILEWMINTLRNMMEQWAAPDDIPPPTSGELINIVITTEDVTEFLNRWVYVRYGLVILLIAAVLGLIWIFFLRTPHRSRQEEAEEVEAERITLGGDLLNRGLQRLRNLADLMRRYGVGTQLLAAISVENIYANVSRTASQRGYPRHPSQPPDDYLPILRHAYPGCDAELGRLTDAYMRVEYGDHALNANELASLRSDYDRVQSSEPPDAAPATVA